MNILSKAIVIAAAAHIEQTDKGGKPYILHPIRMMMRLRTDDEELMAIAILHDVVEDSGIGFDFLLEEGITKRIVDALICLTKQEGEDYDSFISRVLTNKDAMIVKLEDLRDNSDITRLKGLREKDFERLEKYSKAYSRISKALSSF